MTADDIQPGNSYGCKFRTKTYLDPNGKPTDLSQLPKNPADVKIGDWISWGLIAKRDSRNQLLEIKDQQITRTWILHYSDVWDIDLAEYNEDEND